MKRIKILISDGTGISSVISSLDRQIPESTQKSPEFQMLYSQLTACIEDFSAKAKTLGKAGTTIHIQKEFMFPGASVLVVLDYPRKVGLLERLAGFLKRE